MSKDCNCGGDCCTENKSIPKLRKLIREMIGNEISSTQYEIQYWARNKEGDMDLYHKKVQATTEDDAIQTFLKNNPLIKEKHISKVSKVSKV